MMRLRASVPRRTLAWEPPDPLPGVRESFARASGPGGQHVNTTSSKCVLRLPRRGAWLPAEVRRRLVSRMTVRGELVVTADAERSAHRNRARAHAKLRAILREAGVEPAERLATSVPAKENERRLRAKKRRGEVKARRQKPSRDDF